jgi:hypothetical protein
LAANCVVLGAVLSEVAIVVGPGCTVGAPGAPATITAPHIEIAPGVTVYGTLWAEKKGWTAEAATFIPASAAGQSSRILPAHGVLA